MHKLPIGYASFTYDVTQTFCTYFINFLTFGKDEQDKNFDMIVRQFKDPTVIIRLRPTRPVFGDHLMSEFCINRLKVNVKPLKLCDWRQYSKESLLVKLIAVDWNINKCSKLPWCLVDYNYKLYSRRQLSQIGSTSLGLSVVSGKGPYTGFL